MRQLIGSLQVEAKSSMGYNHSGREIGGEEHQLTWSINEERSGATRSQLRFRVPMNDMHYPSISLIFRSQRVCRTDRTRPHVCKPNLLDAQKLGLQAEVCELHIHAWSDNRLHIARAWSRDGH